jgi:hypothetical protein
MALYYNLSKVYAQSNNDSSTVLKTITHFVNQSPKIIKELTRAVKEKEYELVYQLANQIKPSTELVGMTITHDDILHILSWASQKGKRKEIAATVENVRFHIEKAVKEIKKDFEIDLACLINN